MNGLIFASYPFGITVTSMFSTRLIVVIGIRKAVAIGLFSTVLFTIAFGFIPDIIQAKHLQQYGFLVSYFLSGLGGALAETACIIIVANRFSDRLGTIMASVGTVCGLGCMAGPPLGGVLYDIGSTPEWQFRIPFLVFGALPLLLVIAVAKYMPSQSIDDTKDQASLWSVMSPSLMLTTVAIALSGTIVATLDPTLAGRLGSPPFNWNTTKIGLMFMISSIAYVASSVPVGMVVDKFPNSPRTYKIVQAAGLLVLFLTFVILGPFKLGGFDAGSTLHLNTAPMVMVAMILKGLGSSGNNAAYPDMVVGIPEEDELLQAAISGIWNAAYALGWAAGPLMGGVLEQKLKFDGFASITALVALVYGVVLLLAGLLNVRPKEQEVSEAYLSISQRLIMDPIASSGRSGMSASGRSNVSIRSSITDVSAELDIKRAMFSRNLKDVTIPAAHDDFDD
eukprot:g2146.t1